MASTPSAPRDLGGHYPTFDTVRELPNTSGTVAIQKDILADLDTPVSAFLKIREGDLSFLLESVEGGERIGRFSFIGNGSWRWELPRCATADSPVGGITPADYAPLRQKLEQMRTVFPSEDARFDGGVLGYLSYEAVSHMERIPVTGRDVLGLPDGLFMGVDSLLIFDHLRHTVRVLSHMGLEGDRQVEYAAAVGRIDRMIERLR